MHLCLIGMSNIGKSHWSRQLAKEGFERVECDAMVEHKLGGELIKLGYSGIHDVAKWMGQPYDARYAETSHKYLDCERETMRDIIEKLKDKNTPPQVIDTTGSVIYTGSDIIEALRKLTLTVYFQASPEHVGKLFEKYIANPKPVIWGDSYQPEPGESPMDTLRRCYPLLLSYRAERYNQMAAITVPYETHKAEGARWADMVKA